MGKALIWPLSFKSGSLSIPNSETAPFVVTQNKFRDLSMLHVFMLHVRKLICA
jgi:hypothetical protein